MSLINQVLCDLQGRQASCGDISLRAQIRPVLSGRRRLYLVPLLVCGVLATLLCLQLLFPQAGNYSSADEKGVDFTPDKVSLPETAKNDPLGGMRRLLAAVQFKTAEKYSRLLIEFSQPSALPLEVQVVDRRMTILLPGLIPDIQQLPQPGANDALVSHLELLRRDRLWQLEVLFKADVRVEELSLAADRLHGERLIVDIFPQFVETVAITIPALISKDKSEQEPEVKRLQPAAEVAKQVRVLTEAEQADEYFLRGLESARNQQMQSAMQYWQQALRLRPEHLQVRKQLILGFLPINRGLADDLFTAGLMLHEPSELHKWYARAVLPIEGAAAAVAILDGHQVSVDEDEEYRALQAGLWQQAGNYPRSMKGYLELLQSFPDNSLYLFGLALALDQQAKEQDALESYRKALDSGLESELKTYARTRIEVLVTNVGAGN